MHKKHYNRVGLIGAGLIGSSIALGLRKQGVVDTWVGMDINSAVIRDALNMGVIQEVTNDLGELVREVEWLLVSVPVKTTRDLAERIVSLIQNPDYFIMDVGSTKEAIVAGFDAAFKAQHKPNVFVGCHPIAGKEKTGPLVADADLFRGKTVYLTPQAATSLDCLQAVESLWTSLGAEPRKIDPVVHDEILSVSSHLPHMVAYALMDAVKHGYAEKQISHSLGGGLRDMTRVVASSPEMWGEICVENSANILRQIERFRASLGALYDLIQSRDLDSLKEFFRDKKQFRDLLE